MAAQLLEVFREPKGLWEGAGLAGDRLQVLPVLFHLLWSGALLTDLAGALMQTAWSGRREADGRAESTAGVGSRGQDSA